MKKYNVASTTTTPTITTTTAAAATFSKKNQDIFYAFTIAYDIYVFIMQ